LSSTMPLARIALSMPASPFPPFDSWSFFIIDQSFTGL
jgi:hypothetical protein